MELDRLPAHWTPFVLECLCIDDGRSGEKRCSRRQALFIARAPRRLPRPYKDAAGRRRTGLVWKRFPVF